MAKFFVNENQVQNDKIILEGEDVKHVKDVLRMKKNDILNISDGIKFNYTCKIEELLKSSILLNIVSKEEIKNNSKVEIDLFQGVPKFEKMELIIQKATELGINKIYPIETKRVVVKLDEKTKEKKLARWQKIAMEASKQCKRVYIPQVNQVDNIKNIVEKLYNYDIVLVAYENEQNNFLKQELIKNKSAKKIAIVIGPEGGFDEEDLKYFENSSKIKMVSLGENILRTETAGFAMLAILKYEFDDM